MNESRHTSFDFQSGEHLLQKADELGIELPYQDSIDILLTPATIKGRTIPNRIVVQPMEGYDNDPDGNPGELAIRRYKRYAEGGSGTIWFEAVSVMREGRSNPRQMWINRENVGEFKRLVEMTRECAAAVFGISHNPLLVIQLTHSGRLSKPYGKLLNRACFYNPHLGDREDIEIYDDDELEEIKDNFLRTVKLAVEAGFDAVDIKACHGYLFHEILCNRTLGMSRYSGGFDNRIKYISDIVNQVHEEFPELILAPRIGVYDGIPFPYGFGVSEINDGMDLEEPRLLINRLADNGCGLFNITAGIPSKNPQISRPFNKVLPGQSLPAEHPLEGVSRLISLCGMFQKDYPDQQFVGTGYSYLRQFWPNVGAAVVSRGLASFVGLGRGSFAYPDSPLDLMDVRKLDSKKVCITCSKCSELLKNLKTTGCVVRDAEIYSKIYRQLYQA